MQKQGQEAKVNYIVKGENILLMPYQKEFIPKYNNWMQDDELLEQTGSEMLTLEEEIENQKSWLNDPHKTTFIIFQNLANCPGADNSNTNESNQHFIEDPKFPKECEGHKMIGDINLFFGNHFEDNEAEIMVMIAEKNARKLGLAKEAVGLLESFAYNVLNKDTIIAKIKMGNDASMKFFEKLGYDKYKEIAAFEEVHYKKVFEEGQVAKLDNITPFLSC